MVTLMDTTRLSIRAGSHEWWLRITTKMMRGSLLLTMLLNPLAILGGIMDTVMGTVTATPIVVHLA